MKIEPHADIRNGAVMAMQLLTAFIDEGFSREEALQIVIAMMTQQIKGDK